MPVMLAIAANLFICVDVSADDECVLSGSQQSNAWIGRDLDSGTEIKFGSENLVNTGETLDFYDPDSGQYHELDIVAVRLCDGAVEIEVFDNEIGEYRSFEVVP